MGHAYVRFALANPAAFRLMMATRPPQGHFGPDRELASAAMRVLRENVSAIVPEDVPAAQQRLIAIHAWSLAHGLAMLMLDDQIPGDEEIIDRVLALPGTSPGVAGAAERGAKPKSPKTPNRRLP
jgi:hypothetical protein